MNLSSDIEEKELSHNNNGSQSGNNSINVGIGDFRGAHVNIGASEKPTFTPEQLQICRHPALGGRSIKNESLSVFGVVTGLASLVGLYFTLFQAFPQPKFASWSTLFLFLFMVGMLSLALVFALKKHRFEHFFFRKYYIEAGNRDSLFLSSFTAVCPWCQSKMNLRNVGPKDGPRYDRFICQRNPRQHTIDLDPTILPEIKETND